MAMAMKQMGYKDKADMEKMGYKPFFTAHLLNIAGEEGKEEEEGGRGQMDIDREEGDEDHGGGAGPQGALLKMPAKTLKGEIC